MNSSRRPISLYTIAVAAALIAVVLLASYFAFFRAPRLSGTYVSDDRTITFKPSYTITFLDSGAARFNDNTLVAKLFDGAFFIGEKEFLTTYSINGNRIKFNRTQGSDTLTKELEIDDSILRGTNGEIYRKQTTQ